MRYEITIQADNAEFRSESADVYADHIRPCADEAARMLRDLAETLEQKPFNSLEGIKLYDINGNHVGVCRLVDETQEQRA